ncbi:MAG: Hpt domain-containing protein [Desulfovibrionaceae bacterium]|nr:Hpt domain-containing protein [Desulfovibrionaceae bacterium]
MSQEFMDEELFGDFIIEAREHLETIEPNLLELEKAPDNLSLLNEIFRPMHSMKGASGFLGLNKMNGLAHKAESIMDELRKGAMAVTPEIMDIILATTDALRQMIDSLEATSTEGDVDTEHLEATLDALMAGEMPVAASPASAPPAPADAVEENAAEEEAPALESEAVAEDDAPAVEAPVPVAPPAAPAKTSGVRQTGDVQAWIESRAVLPAYALTAFGEGHLRDFIEEAKDNISSLSDGLLVLEKHPEGQKELVNDLFRYFHNLKGNSGIIGYNEINGLTHEAETLLNSLRKEDAGPVSGPVVDLLLLAVDVLEALIYRIDVASGSAEPIDTNEVLEKLRAAVAGDEVTMPASLMAAAPAGAAAEKAAPPAGEDSVDQDDISVFQNTVEQQFTHIVSALEGMRADGANREFADAMFRSLTTIQNCSSFMGLDEVKTYAQRTAGLVDQGRNSNMDFSIMADLLQQECAIIKDMIEPAIATLAASGAPSAGEPADRSGEAEAAAKAAAPATKPAPAQDKPAPAKKAAKSAPPAKETSAAPAEPKPEPPAAAKTSAPTVPAAVKPVTPVAEAKPAAPAATPPAPAGAGAAAAAGGGDHGGKASSTIRVDHEKLDHLMNLIGELIINRNRYSMLARQLEDNSTDISIIAHNLTETTYAMARISDDLQDTIMKVRMVPVASVFSRFPRLVRDLSRKSGKEVELIMEGEETELDKSVVEVIGDPLVHLIRNSVDHGIEPEDVRVERGKPAKGNVWLRAFYRGNSVAIEIEDDGKGIDPEKMREVAVRKGVITPEEARSLDDREAMELIFAPGFSSAEVITDISGRGVGMDVVRTNIKNLKGSISIASEVGKGTKFTLSLPLTLAIIDALMVIVDNETYAIPLDAVSETTKIESERLTDVKGRKAVTLRGEVLGIVSLGEFLGLNNNMDETEILNVVVIQDNDRRLGLVVDRLLERQEIVIKPLGAYLGDIKGISGATIMGDGSVILILDPHELYLLATSKAS